VKGSRAAFAVTDNTFNLKKSEVSFEAPQCPI
jgi:hypothetical protein